ncbi:MAG: hypothetical protein J1F63_00400 [Oscillospiraceae bacterium]|nr:hypothetical protein [Oscillospiraceae bacterium]
MINSIIEGISAALNKEFGDEYRIYAEKVEQGLKEPCFFITVLNPSSTRYPGDRHRRNNSFCVQLIPAGDSARMECNAAAERLYLCLEWIKAGGDLLRGTGMSYEIADDALSFFVSYNLFVLKAPEPDEGALMEELDHNIKIKE